MWGDLLIKIPPFTVNSLRNYTNTLVWKLSWKLSLKQLFPSPHCLSWERQKASSPGWRWQKYIKLGWFTCEKCSLVWAGIVWPPRQRRKWTFQARFLPPVQENGTQWPRDSLHPFFHPSPRQWKKHCFTNPLAGSSGIPPPALLPGWSPRKGTNGDGTSFMPPFSSTQSHALFFFEVRIPYFHPAMMRAI